MSPFLYLVKHDQFSFVDDDYYFFRALQLARFALGSTHPNPAVGAVIVKNGVIIAEGYTQPAGGMHAEAHALDQAREDVFDATMYVTLEPCCHYGRTPPCTKAIIESGIKRVVYGVSDPNPQVYLEGIKSLTDAGLVVHAINNSQLYQMAKVHIEPFKKWIKEKLPYVVIKIATSKDNKVAAQIGARTKITGPKADLMVHQLRRSMDAVMVGANTVRIDNPKLTARLDENHHEKQPTRVMVSSRLDFDKSLNIFDIGIAKTVIFTDEKAAIEEIDGVEVVGCDMLHEKVDLRDALTKLGARGYTSVLVEAGPTLLKSFLSANLADEIWWLTSSTDLGEAGLDVAVRTKDLSEAGFSEISRYQLGQDEVTIFYPARTISMPNGCC